MQSLHPGLMIRRIALAILMFPFMPMAESLAQESSISMGNGSANWIITEGSTRQGASFVFPEVVIDGDGWLVMHPFKDGKPDGETVAGFTPLKNGRSNAVEITVSPVPLAGDLYIVMLHSDANDNGEFDFVFVNERDVVDKAVFEGSTMIGHVYRTP